MAQRKTPKKSQAKTSTRRKSASRQKTEHGDIIQLILDDHKTLKRLIKVMKNTDKDISEREDAFEAFAPALITHAKPEEETMYTRMKSDEELREEGFEGDVEHALADQLLEEILRTEDEDLWSAKVKVLAELVEHHIEEEEDELLPDFRKHTEVEERVQLGAQFLKLKQKLERQGGKDTVDENEYHAHN